MTFQHFKPEVWSKVILAALQKSLVYGSDLVINRDYEDEISGPGDSVHITSIADPVISTYVPGQTLTYQQLNDAGQTLIVDQSKSFSVAVDDIDKRQVAGTLGTYLEERASYRIGDVADQFLAGFYTAAAPANVLGSSGSPLTPGPFLTTSPADFYIKVIQPLKVALNLANVPDDGRRYMIVPPWALSLIEQTGSFVTFPGNNGGPGSVMENGFAGRISNINVLLSNNTVQTVAGGPGTGVWAIQAGHRMAMTYAEQIAQTEALRLQATFADGIRGLHVYGARVVRPEALAVAYTLRPVGV